MAQVLVLPSSGADGDISHGPASCPVSLAVLAEVSRLIDVVIVVVTEFCVQAVASRARKEFIRLL